MNAEVQQVGAAIDIIRTLAEAIREAGSIPSGHLYAMAMFAVSLEAYEGAIRLLVRTGLVEKTGQLLTWVGPTLDGKS